MKALSWFCAVAGVLSVSTARADDLADVRSVLAVEIRMFATFDETLAPKIYAPDVTWQNPFGVRFHSEAALQGFLARLFRRPGYRSGKDTSAPAITDVRLIGPDVAVAWSEETSSGQIEHGKPLGLRKSHYLEVLHKSGGAWLITDEMIMDEK